jgi:parallel beta-helix repeat protein
MKSEIDTVIIDAAHSPWYLTPLIFENISNKVMVLEEGVEIIAKAGAFPRTNDALITLVDCDNFRILGNSAKLCMQKKEYLTGEWRHGISIRGSRNVKIQDLVIRDTGGDGIYIAGSNRNLYSENIVIKSIRSVNNRRQGISIISAKNVQVHDSRFSKTVGTFPGAGIDIEPNKSEDTIENIFVSNCIFEDNFGAGIVISLGKLTSSSTPISIQFDNCMVKNNHSVNNDHVAAEIIVTANGTSPVKGQLAFSNCIIRDSKWGMLYSRKLADAYSVSFVDCYVRNISSKGSYPIIYFEVPNYYENKGPLGGFSFKNLYVEETNGANFMTVRGSKIGTLSEIKDISANVISTEKFEEPVEYINYFSQLNNEVNLNFITKR